jgi:hypothetical protein
MARATTSISFKEIVNGRDATVRVTHDSLLYAVDLVATMTGKDVNQANECLRDLNQSLFNKNKFVVRNRARLVTLEHAIELIFILPGIMAKSVRKQFADIIVRYLDGDTSMCCEIETNKAMGKLASYSKYANSLMRQFDTDKAAKAFEMPQTNYVYATKSPAFPGLVKIGKTEHVPRRVSQLNTSCAPSPHAVVAVAPSFDQSRDERTAHAFFASARREGEFFELDDATVIAFFATHITAQYNMELIQNIARMQGQCVDNDDDDDTI